MLKVVDPIYCLGTHQNVAFAVWHGQCELRHVEQIQSLFGSLLERYPKGIGVITVVANDAVPVAAEARKPLSNAYLSLGKQLLGVSMVIEASGLKGTSMRFVINGLQLLVRPDYPVETHQSLDEAAKWLSGKVGVSDLNSELAKLVAQYEEKRRTLAGAGPAIPGAVLGSGKPGARPSSSV